MDSRIIGCLGVAERVAGSGVLKTDSRSDISGVNAVDILSVVGVHLQDSSQTLVAVLGSSCKQCCRW